MRFREGNTRVLVPLVATCLVLAAPHRMSAQEAAPAAARPVAAPADVDSIDAIVAALYDVISGPAGQRDWDRFLSLFAPGAVLSPMVPRADGSVPVRVITPADYVKIGGAYFAEHPFFEREAARRLSRFGNVANVMSLYESRNAAEDPEPFTSGVNSVTLIRDAGRWYVLAVAWDEVRDGNPLPQDYGD